MLPALLSLPLPLLSLPLRSPPLPYEPLPYLPLVSAAEAPRAALATTLAEVTFYPDAARVLRRAVLPAGAEALVIEGLPTSLDRSSLRVRTSAGELVRLELRERRGPATDDSRLGALRGELQALEAELAALQDRRQVASALGEHLLRLLAEDTAPDAAAGAERVASWRATLPFLRAELETAAEEQRQVGAAIEQLTARRDELRRELGRLADGAAEPKLELELLLFGTEAGGQLELEYLVGGAGWEPYYDLRADAELRTVTLEQRARVWQQSGEDWLDVALALSTAEPRRGAHGPVPQTCWLDLRPETAGGSSGFLVGLRDTAPASAAALGEGAAPEARIVRDGLSLRYQLPRLESIHSRGEPTAVWIARTPLAVEVERFCVPADDPAVWVRGRAVNSTGGTLLEGVAAVFVGAEYLGQAPLPRVQPGGEFELPLGLDPQVTVERVLVADRTRGPGFFGSTQVERRHWRVRATNARGEPLQVWIHESLPRSRDGEVEVALEPGSATPSAEERWQRWRDERGILTFPLLLPAGGEAALDWTQAITWPADRELLRS
jgi:uncharacterized protein (TIGR02231 family)